MRTEPESQSAFRCSSDSEDSTAKLRHQMENVHPQNCAQIVMHCGPADPGSGLGRGNEISVLARV